jgi:hypothetical protein
LPPGNELCDGVCGLRAKCVVRTAHQTDKLLPCLQNRPQVEGASFVGVARKKRRDRVLQAVLLAPALAAAAALAACAARVAWAAAAAVWGHRSPVAAAAALAAAASLAAAGLALRLAVSGAGAGVAPRAAAAAPSRSNLDAAMQQRLKQPGAGPPPAPGTFTGPRNSPP